MFENLWIHILCLTLRCVFHSIRFKVNKVGTQRSPIFLCLDFCDRGVDRIGSRESRTCFQ
ncbi:hypothetical protein C7120_11630 [Prevotella sp. oral taxon 376]|nr:hypothetical protein C7120_11630 [Prevotella sp. oral taxon 376]